MKTRNVITRERTARLVVPLSAEELRALRYIHRREYLLMMRARRYEEAGVHMGTVFIIDAELEKRHTHGIS